MKKLMRLIRAGESVQKVLTMTAHMQEEEFDSLKAINDDDYTVLSVWASKAANVVGVEQIVSIGCILAIVCDASQTESRQNTFNRMLCDLQLSRTQAYRNIAVWRRAGKAICDDTTLAHMFVPEALKLLCEQQCPEAAFDEALKMASCGLAVDIKTAKKLRSAFQEEESEKVDPETGTPTSLSVVPQPDSVEKKRPGVWKSFTGRVVKIALEFCVDPADVEHQKVIDDILAFANQLADQNSPITKPISAAQA